MIMCYSDKHIRKILLNYFELKNSMYYIDPFEETVSLSVDVDRWMELLTKREKQVILTVSTHGYKNASSALKISEPTLKYFISNAVSKISKNIIKDDNENVLCS